MWLCRRVWFSFQHRAWILSRSCDRLAAGQRKGDQFWGRDILYYPIPGGLAEVRGEWILCQTSNVCLSKNLTVPSSNFVLSTMASTSGHSSFDPYDLSSNVEDYLMPKSAAEMRPRRSARAARSVTTARLYLNSPPEVAKNCGQIIPNSNNYHSDPMEINSPF